jgi:hypothetical protein
MNVKIERNVQLPTKLGIISKITCVFCFGKIWERNKVRFQCGRSCKHVRLRFVVTFWSLFWAAELTKPKALLAGGLGREVRNSCSWDTEIEIPNLKIICFKQVRKGIS